MLFNFYRQPALILNLTAWQPASVVRYLHHIVDFWGE